MSSEQAATPERPWLGLARFTKDSSDYFYGRDAEIAELHDRVLRATLTVLYGISGNGKSSLLGAGLIPILEKEGFQPIAFPRFVFDDGITSPLMQTLTLLCNQLPSIADRAKSLALNHRSLWEFFHDRALQWWQPTESTYVRPVLIFDQCEDFFSQGEDKGGVCARSACDFLTSLADLVENRPPTALHERLQTDRTLVRAYDFQSRPVKVVISLREDFLARLLRWRRVLPSLVENQLELRSLSGPQALRAVIEPAHKRCRLRSAVDPERNREPIVTDTTAAAIVRFIAGVGSDVPLADVYNVPPLLSLICAQLNEHRFAGPHEEIPIHEQIPLSWIKGVSSKDGGDRTAADSVLERFYTDSFAEFPEAVRYFVEDRLVSSPGGSRELVTSESAVEQLKDKVDSPNVALDRLIDQRLLVVEESGGARRIELTHDILAGLALRSRREREQRESRARRQRALLQRIGVALIFLSLVSLSLILYGKHRRDLKLATDNVLKQEREDEDRRRKKIDEENQSKLTIERENAGRSLEMERSKTAAADRRLQELVVFLKSLRGVSSADLRNALDAKFPEISANSKEAEESVAEAERQEKIDAQRAQAADSERRGDESRERGDLKRAYDLYLKSHELREQLSASYPDNSELKFELSSSYNNLANVLFDQKRYSEALERFTRALQIRRALVDANESDPRWQRSLFFSLLNTSDTLFQLKRIPDAVGKAQEALDIAQKLAAKEAHNPTWKKDKETAQTQINRLRNR
jgi:tetratricopeptide (TPR) repeat protein